MIRNLLPALCVAFLGFSLLSAGEFTAQIAKVVPDGDGNDDVDFTKVVARAAPLAEAAAMPILTQSPGQTGGSPGAGGGSPENLNGLPPLPALDLILAELDFLLDFLLEEVFHYREWAARQ